MAEIELVIKIPEGLKNDFESEQWTALSCMEMKEALERATPLPKGHRFIDADEILDHAFIREDEDGDIFVQKYYCIRKEIVDNALVLFDTLEADKESEDKE